MGEKTSKKNSISIQFNIEICKKITSTIAWCQLGNYVYLNNCLLVWAHDLPCVPTWEEGGWSLYLTQWLWSKPFWDKLGGRFLFWQQCYRPKSSWFSSVDVQSSWVEIFQNLLQWSLVVVIWWKTQDCKQSPRKISFLLGWLFVREVLTPPRFGAKNFLGLKKLLQ